MALTLVVLKATTRSREYTDLSRSSNHMIYQSTNGTFHFSQGKLFAFCITSLVPFWRELHLVTNKATHCKQSKNKLFRTAHLQKTRILSSD